MLLTSRIATFRAQPGEVVPAASGICDRIKEVAGLDITLWMGGPGYPVGTMVWSAIAESHAQYGDVGAQLMADGPYLELVGQLTPHATDTGEQVIREFVHMTTEPDGTSPPVGAATWVVSAQIANGQISNAMTWGVEVAELVKATTGADVAFTRDLYGPWGTVTWLTPFENMAALDEAQAKMSASEDYLAKVDSGAPLFNPGAARSGLVSRVH